MTSEDRADWEAQRDEWQDWERDCLSRARCPYSGGVLITNDDGLVRCGGVCDCFGYEPAEIAEAKPCTTPPPAVRRRPHRQRPPGGRRDEVMYLSDLIDRLEKEDPALVFMPGWHNPHSWRGSYSELAFEPKESATVAECLAAAREADGSTYKGWKGGEYTMSGWSECYLAEQGGIGSELSDLAIDLLVAAAKTRAEAAR